MALRTSRPRPLLQDENAQHGLLSGKASAGSTKGKGLGLGLKQQPQSQPQQQPPPLAERKKLSNITNQVINQQQQGHSLGKGAPLEKVHGSFSSTVKADPESGRGFSKPSITDASSVKAAAPGLGLGAGPQEAVAGVPRPPLKNITNGGVPAQRPSQDVPKTLPKQKPKVDNQSQPAAVNKHLPNVSLPEEMKRKAALWAEEGIERVHFSGEDMEKLRQKLEYEEIAKRVAMAVNCRTELPFPRFRPSSLHKKFLWEPSDVLELDVLSDPPEEDNDSSLLQGIDRDCSQLDELLLSYTDYISVCSPPKLPNGWPSIIPMSEEEEEDLA